MPDPTPLLQTPIAIIGMSCCLPGARGLEEFWELLAAGRCAIGEMPPDRLDRTLYYSPDKGVRGTTYSTLGGLISPRPLSRIASLLTATELENADLCHQILCDVAIEACEDARFDVGNFPLRNTGVYVGHSGGSPLGGDLAMASLAAEAVDYLWDVPEFASLDRAIAAELVREAVDRIRSRRPRRGATGGPDVDANYAAALIAKALQLNGPHMVIDAACASSLVALATAALALNQGQVDAALVGGASFNKCDSLILFSHAQSCSASGSRPFDSQADGLIGSEGYATLVLKLLPRAISDGDRIHAVIRGIGLSSDGRGRSLWAPRKEGQFAAVQRAYGPGADPRDVQFIEAHATSTQVGDATELEALSDYFTPHGSGRTIPIGSVKSNIGHSLETAGLAGLLKVVLAMQHRQIPPTVNLQEPNPKIPWKQLRFTVPTSVEPWPDPMPGKSRCAAVNAFGIGGLNTHLVVEEYEARTAAVPFREPAFNRAVSPDTPPVSAVPPQRMEAIAVIGRGVILPGAQSIAEWTELIQSERCVLADAPRSRWRHAIGVEPGSRRPWTTPTNRGGYIRGYSYDWKTHKIPPKQVLQANPLQFMLLDAARQALVEAGYDSRPYAQDTTAVVVGNTFGGEFGNQLQVGLRLPELRREITGLLGRRGIPAVQAHRIVEAYERILVEAKPALLDETGSFTCSTLASRIAKTLNLMGGAMAIDAGDCSSLAALSLAVGLLQSQTCSAVLCAAAQRALDLPSYESLARRGHLEGCSGTEGGGYLPGEGVVVLLLKRLADAKRDGDRVITVIRGLAGGMDRTDRSQAVALASQRALAAAGWQAEDVPRFEGGCGVASLDADEAAGLTASYGTAPVASRRSLVHQIGHTQAAHGLATLLRASVASPAENVALTTQTYSGLAYHLLLSPVAVAQRPRASVAPATAADIPASGTPPRLVRLSAASADDLAARVAHALPDVAGIWESAHEFTAADGARLAVLASSPDELRAKLTVAQQQWGRLEARPALCEQAIFFALQPATKPLRVAFAFPGQGSQYPGMLQGLVSLSPAANHTMREADRQLQEQFGQTFGGMAWNGASRLGTDVWLTQMVMLIADCIAWSAIRELGVTPDTVFGHSFGEIAALVAAEAITLEQAIRLTNARARSMDALGTAKSSMLAIDAAPAALERLLAFDQEPIYLSHHNAPEQTVVGGCERAIARLEAKLAAAGISARQIPVPTAYHTPLMLPTVAPWRAALATAVLRPPRIPLLSSVTTRYVAEPNEIRENLVQQMTTPIRYVDLVERLVSDGVDLLLEVGPQQILTRLHRRIVAGRSVSLAAIDHPKRSAAEQLCRVRAELECLGWRPAMCERVGTATEITTAVLPPEVLHCDATVPRKTRLRRVAESQGATERSTPLLTPAETFDATSVRRARQRNRTAQVAFDVTSPPSDTRAMSPGDTDSSCEAARSPGDLLPALSDVTAPAAACAGTLATTDELEKFLVDFVVEQTGYPAELIDFDWDMEADLGIDSIKRAQLFGELREFFELDMTARASLSEFRTLRQVLDLLRERGGKAEWLKSEGPTARAKEIPSDRSTIQDFLIDFVVEQTGYPREIVDLDADLEADLGIDSIKKAQLLGELREQFQLQSAESGPMSLADYSTLRQVLDQLCQSPGAATTVPSRSQPSSQQAGTEEVMPLAPPASAADPVLRRRYELGYDRSQRQAGQVRAVLRAGADQLAEEHRVTPSGAARFTAEEWSELQGLADGAGVHVGNVAAFQTFRAAPQSEAAVLRLSSPPSESCDATRGVGDLEDRPPTVTRRYVLRMCPSPLQTPGEAAPDWHGAAVIVGDNELGRRLRDRFQESGRTAYCIVPTDDPQDAVRTLEQIWTRERAPHLFLVTPRDPDAAIGFQEPEWGKRRARGVMTPFWVCQRWVQLTTEAGLLNESTLVGVTSLGGDFGFGGDIVAPESGALTGLLKAILIECWVNGFRSLPIKLLDAPPTELPADIVNAIWQELSTPSYDLEIAWHLGERSVVRAYEEPLRAAAARPIRHGGVWVCTGGARGITGLVARELAQRFHIRLHLLGASPTPNIPDAWRQLPDDGLRKLKLEVMQAARRDNRSPVKEWERTEKALEIDRTLRELHALGIAATYHSCDVSNREALTELLAAIRRTDGPIEGILHGAGVGKDARFDRKEPQRVDECIRAKVDGAWALIEATRNDPLRYFVAFGSISGRFGANGHTDYSLANDMLCKQAAWLRQHRPEVKSVGFHWHAWGGVGMATKPETRLALEMVGMQFMPAAEGVNHLIRELESDASNSEVLITDDRYYRLFYPAETLASRTSSGTVLAPELPLLGNSVPTEVNGVRTLAMTLDPVAAPYLVEHRLDDRPLLPIVIGLELLGEAAVQQAGGGELLALRDVDALHGLRFFTDRPLDTCLRVEALPGQAYRCELVADFRARDGRLVEPNRCYLRGIAEVGAERRLLCGSPRPFSHENWESVSYPPRGSKMYLGPPLHCLKKILVGQDVAWGRISAPALAELAGPSRSVAGWRVPSAAIDACLFATGILCWQRVAAGATLPARLGRIEFGRLPRPGEACIVETRFVERHGRHAVFHFVLFGQNKDILVRVTDYRVVWLAG